MVSPGVPLWNIGRGSRVPHLNSEKVPRVFLYDRRRDKKDLNEKVIYNSRGSRNELKLLEQTLLRIDWFSFWSRYYRATWLFLVEIYQFKFSVTSGKGSLDYTFCNDIVMLPNSIPENGLLSHWKDLLRLKKSSLGKCF